MTDILNENISNDELKDYLKEFYNYACKRHNIGMRPRLFLKQDSANADDFLGKTGYYDPNKKEIYLYITNRHPKDVVRSLSHELIHHKQNLEGRLGNIEGTSKDGYALEDGPLRELEREAFTDGDLTFRDWTDLKKLKRTQAMKEQKEKPPFEDGEEKTKLAGKRRAKKLAIKARKKMEIKASEQAKADMNSRMGKGEKDELPENLNEGAEDKKNENENNPYPQLFVEKERLLKDAFNKKEELIYQELLRRFIKK